MLKKAMELTILTKCQIMLAIYDPQESRLSIYKSMKNDEEFAQNITMFEAFSENDVNLVFLIHWFSSPASLKPSITRGRIKF